VTLPRLLREDRRFRAFWCGQTTSLAGDQVGLVALPLTAVLALHVGPGAMGVLTAAGWVPSLLISLHAGAWVDRSGRRREAMIAADLGRAALLATVPVAWALGVLTFAQLAAVAFFVGSLGVIATVATTSLSASLVPRERLVEAGALVNGSRAGTSVGGPGVAGALVAAVGAPLALLADAASFVGSALWLRRVRAPAPTGDGGEGGLVEGARFIGRSRLVRASLASGATINLFQFAVSALFAVYAVRALHVSAAELGLVLSLGGVGAVAGSLVTRRIVAAIGIGPAYMLGCVLFTAPLLLVPAAGGPHGLALALLLAAELGTGFGVMVLDISVGAILAAAVPEPLRARVQGAYSVVNYGVRPLGALGGGALAAAVGMRPTLWIAAAGALLGVLWCLPSPLPRLRALPQPPVTSRRTKATNATTSAGIP
jgi:MFS family permease